MSKNKTHHTRSNPCHYSHPREHWTRKNGVWTPKKAFASEEEARKFLKDLNYHNNHYTVYLCPVCSQWHIGYSVKNNQSYNIENDI